MNRIIAILDQMNYINCSTWSSGDCDGHFFDNFLTFFIFQFELEQIWKSAFAVITNIHCCVVSYFSACNIFDNTGLNQLVMSDDRFYLELVSRFSRKTG